MAQEKGTRIETLEESMNDVRCDATHAVRIGTIHADGFAMDYLQFGRGQRALAILPGLSVESVVKYASDIADAYELLVQDFTIYLLDRRKQLPPAYPVAEMAKDTAAAIRELGLERISLFGASQGGMIAMLIAAEHPKLVDKLILGSTSAYLEKGQCQVIEEWIHLAESGDATALYCAFGDAIYPPDVAEQARDYMAACAKTVSTDELERFVILAQGMRGFDARESLANITCPVLLTGSEDDRVLGPGATREIAQRLVNCASLEMRMYDGFGHAAYDTAPNYKEAMLRFLK